MMVSDPYQKVSLLWKPLISRLVFFLLLMSISDIWKIISTISKDSSMLQLVFEAEQAKDSSFFQSGRPTIHFLYTSENKWYSHSKPHF